MLQDNAVQLDELKRQAFDLVGDKKVLYIFEGYGKLRYVQEMMDNGEIPKGELGYTLFHIKDFDGHGKIPFNDTETKIEKLVNFKNHEEQEVTIKKLKEKIEAAEIVFLMTDPDLDGEVIIMTLREEFKEHSKKFVKANLISISSKNILSVIVKNSKKKYDENFIRTWIFSKYVEYSFSQAFYFNILLRLYGSREAVEEKGWKGISTRHWDSNFHKFFILTSIAKQINLMNKKTNYVSVEDFIRKNTPVSALFTSTTIEEFKKIGYVKQASKGPYSIELTEDGLKLIEFISSDEKIMSYLSINFVFKFKASLKAVMSMGDQNLTLREMYNLFF